MEKEPQQIKWIAFDYGGTLAEVGPPIDVDVMHTILKKDFNISLPTNFKKLFNVVVEQGKHEAKKTAVDYSLVTCLETVLKRLDLRTELPLKEIVTRFNEHIEDGTPYPNVKITLNTLHERGYSLLLAANTFRNKARREKTLRLAGLSNFFEHFILSSEIGYLKPHREFYRNVIQAAGVAPNRIVFVGDTFEKDVIAPALAGMYTIWVNRDSEIRPIDFPNYIGQVKTILEILELLT